jgi:hypothetical protein
MYPPLRNKRPRSFPPAPDSSIVSGHGLLQVDCAVEAELIAKRVLDTPGVHAGGERRRGLRISTPVSMRSGIKSKTAPQVWKKIFASARVRGCRR